MGNKSVANLPGGQASLNSLLYGSGAGNSFSQRGYSGNQTGNQVGAGGSAGGVAGNANS